ncbi:flagellin N-terminal helical domain-containing protein, partial [Hydrogenimonas sp.]
MGFRINTNVAAMDAHRNSLQTNLRLNKDLQQLSSGLRINTAADDASGLAIANTLRQQAQGLGQAIANANDGIGVLQTADGALEEYENIINTIRTKSIQAASDGQNADTRAKIQADINRLLEEAQNIASTTSFNGQTLLNGGFHDKSFHIGAYSGETVNISIGNTQIANVAKFAMDDSSAISSGNVTGTLTITSGTGVSVSINLDNYTATGNTSLENVKAIVDAFNAQSQSKGAELRASVFAVDDNGSYGIRIDSAYGFNVSSTGGTGLATTATSLTNNLSTVDVTTRGGAEKAVIIADYALRDIDNTRSDIGSVQNQLESTIRNISVTQVNVTAAESQIRDVDFAAVSADFNKNNILAQSGSYAMS